MVTAKGGIEAAPETPSVDRIQTNTSELCHLKSTIGRLKCLILNAQKIFMCIIEKPSMNYQ